MSREMREVDLVEDDHGVPSSPSPHAPRRRPSWRWLLATAVCVIASLVMLQTAVDARRQLADDGRARDVLAIPAPPRTLAPLWKVEGAAARSTRVGTLLVGATVVDGQVDVVGLDPRSGDPVWSVATPAVPEVSDLAADEVECASHDVSRVVCVVVRRAPTTTGPAQVVVVDPGTRTLVGTWTSTLEGWAQVGDLVVTAAPDEDGATFGWTLTAHDEHGATAWTTRTSRAPLGTEDAGALDADATPLFGRLLGEPGWLAITDRDHAWVVRADGTVLDDRDVGAGVVLASRSGAPAVVQGPLGSSRTTLLLDDGGLELPGLPVAPGTDDGSAADVDLWTADGDVGTGLVARDATTGTELWRDLRGDAGSVAVHDGVVYVAGRDEVRALDAADGRLLWRAPLAGVDSVTLADGVVVAASAENLTVRALAPRTGRAVWEADVRDVVPGRRALFVATWSGLVHVVVVGDEQWVIG